MPGPLEVSLDLLVSRCGGVSCCEYSPPVVCVCLQPTVPVWHQPGPPLAPLRPLQVQLWLQLQMPPLRTSPQSRITQSHVGELCTPGLSRWGRILSAAGIGELGLGIILINTLNVLSTGCEVCTWCFFCFLGFFVFCFLIKLQGSTQRRQWYQGDQIQGTSGSYGCVYRRLVGSLQTSIPGDCVLRVTVCPAAYPNPYTLGCIFQILALVHFLFIT